MNRQPKSLLMLTGVTALFLALAACFWFNLWGHTHSLPLIPLVDPQFTNTATVRVSYADILRIKADPLSTKEALKRAEDDASVYDCYGCHDRKKPPVLQFNAKHELIVPSEHEDEAMKHGTHDRNNNCFNCHNETNLVMLQTRDGHEVKLEESVRLCGSCHGPTYRDWEAGVHGRTSGHWNRPAGAIDPKVATRKLCVNCHNPHRPAFPGRKPAPGPHPLRAPAQAALAQDTHERSH